MRNTNSRRNEVLDSPTSIHTDRGTEDVLDLLSRNVRFVKIKTGNTFTPVRVRDIPISIYHLDCGCTGKGIAVDVGNTIFCQTHSVHSEVVDAWK